MADSMINLPLLAKSIRCCAPLRTIAEGLAVGRIVLISQAFHHFILHFPSCSRLLQGTVSHYSVLALHKAARLGPMAVKLVGVFPRVR
jgi:hypothetical protein